jgi:hypothetical protein
MGTLTQKTHPQGPVALLPLVEDHHEQTQGGGSNHGRPGTLDEPGGHEEPEGGGDAGGERCGAEEGRPEEEQPPTPEPVAQPPAEEEEAAEGQHVAVDHPAERALGGHVEVTLDRGQGHIDDGRVQDEHELHGHQQGQCPTLVEDVLIGRWHLGLLSQ